jgi:uncharacterized lipoprotein YmbA
MKSWIICIAVSLLTGCATVTPQRMVEIYNTSQNLGQITGQGLQAELRGRLHYAR